MRVLLLALVLIAAAPLVAVAQEPVDPDAVEEVEPVESVDPVETPDGEPSVDEEYADCRYAGADADYTYGCCRGGADADYVYADDRYLYCPAQPGGTGPTKKKKKLAAQPLAAGALPVTGSEVGLILFAGLGLLLAGYGLRLVVGSGGVGQTGRRHR